MRIYAGNLQREFTEGDVRELFSTHGQVDSVAIILDPDTRRSKGFAFIEMPSNTQAKAAIKALNGQIFHQPTRTLTVNEARPRQERTVTVNENRLRPERSLGGGNGSGGFGNRGGGSFVSRNSPWSGTHSGSSAGNRGGGGGGSRNKRGNRGPR